jgi:AcrR family transcriptional regulator
MRQLLAGPRTETRPSRRKCQTGTQRPPTRGAVIDSVAVGLPAEPGRDDADPKLGWRAQRTRGAILDASRKLFLERGYAGTRIGNITEACGISRAGFYTYFKDKREIFNALGETTYHEITQVVGQWKTMPRQPGAADIEGWVRGYMAFMDVHGAFFLSAHTAPTDEDVRRSSRRMQMRNARNLGTQLRDRQAHPSIAADALGLTVLALLDRTWYQTKVVELPVGFDAVVASCTTVILELLRA